MTIAGLEAFQAVQNGDALSPLTAALLEAFEPYGGAIAPGLSRFDRIQNGKDLRHNQSDCNWFAFDAGSVFDEQRFSGIIALHRTGKRIARLSPGLRPVYDSRPLFLSALYDHAHRTVLQREVPVDGEFDEDTFSIVSNDGRRQLIQAPASSLRGSVPAPLRAFFARDTPAFAIHVATDLFELELFLRAHKDPVVYGVDRTPALQGERLTIHYVQRPRLDLVGLVRRRSRAGWEPAIPIRGEATQDRHWMTVTRLGVRWMWLMARLDDGRECMAFEMRSAAGGRKAPADAGRPIGGGAWIVEPNGTVRQATRWSLTPHQHETTPRGLVPKRFALDLPDERLRLVVEHELRAFVPTKALGELVEAGIRESPARLVEGDGVSGGQFWVDVMPPYGGV